jgi:hypothetical protein
MKSLDLKTLLIGLLLGVCITLSMAQRAAEPAHKLDADNRYQISAVQEASGTSYLYILDHETKKVYRRQVWDNGQGFDVKRAIAEQR